MDKLFSYKLFVKLVETKSFTKTAQQLFMTQPNVSRIIKELEAKLDTHLLKRSTRSFQITESGYRLYHHAKLIDEEIREFEGNFEETKFELSGHISVTVPLFIRDVFYSVIGDFLLEHPKIDIKLNISNKYLDLVENGFDLALQIGEEPKADRSNKVLIGERQMIMVASKEYLNKFGCPKHPKELLDHNCLIFSPYEQSTWAYRENNQNCSVQVVGNLSTNSMTPVVDCLKSGVGIAYLPYYYLIDELKTGEVVEILQQFRPKPDLIYMAHSFTNFIPRKVSVFIDFIKQHTCFYKN